MCLFLSSGASFAAQDSVQMWALNDAPFAMVDGKGNSIDQIKRDIVFASNVSGWSIVGEAAGSVTLHREKAPWSVDVLLTFNAKSFSISYLKSENLGYETNSAGMAKIHPNYNIWVQRLVMALSPTTKLRNIKLESPSILAAGDMILHYRRPQGDYRDWGMHYWGDAYDSQTTWFSPLKPSGEDEFGLYFKLKMNTSSDFPSDAEAYFMLHKGEAKDACQNEMFWDYKKSREIYVTSGDCTVHYSKEDAVNSRYFR